MPGEPAADDEEARRKRAAELHRAIDEAVAGERRPRSPRELTDEQARETAEDEEGDQEPEQDG